MGRWRRGKWEKIAKRDVELHFLFLPEMKWKRGIKNIIVEVLCLQYKYNKSWEDARLPPSFLVNGKRFLFLLMVEHFHFDFYWNLWSMWIHVWTKIETCFTRCACNFSRETNIRDELNAIPFVYFLMLWRNHIWNVVKKYCVLVSSEADKNNDLGRAS